MPALIKNYLTVLRHRHACMSKLTAARFLSLGDAPAPDERRRDLKLNYDLTHLQNLSQEQLIYKVVRLQRTVDSYHHMFDAQHFDGRDKIRVPHPDPESINTGPCSLRRIAFKVLYLGWQYQSYAYEGVPKGNTNVVERVLLEALIRQQLISNMGPKINLDRSGRTDRLVSGLSQTVAINLRSSLKEGYGVWRLLEGDDDDGADRGAVKDNTVYFTDNYSPSDTTRDADELPYVRLINQALPYDIRVLAWTPVRRSFSCRYDCTRRTYRYVFPRGDLDIELMNEAAKQFIGEHDFRHFCKISGDNAFKHFLRNIHSFDIEPCETSVRNSNTAMCAAMISGSSYLQRQVRMMMSVLMMIGTRQVPPSVITDLLDIEKTPRKPMYSACNPQNLMLVDTQYEDDDICWRWDDEALAHTAGTLARMYGSFATKSNVLEYMFSQVLKRVTDEKLRNSALAVLADSSKPEVTYGLSFDNNGTTLNEKREKLQRRLINTKLKRGQYQFAAELAEQYKHDSVSHDHYDGNDVDNDKSRSSEVVSNREALVT